MQKKLIALAIAGLASTAAFAQTNVTVYGIADGTFGVVDQSDATNRAGQNVGLNKGTYNNVAFTGSYIGFKGTEDLGNGLKAIFQIETGVDFSNVAQESSAFSSANNNKWASRDSFVGLSDAKWGTLVMGNLTGPTRALGAAMDVNAGAITIGTINGLSGKVAGYGTGAFLGSASAITGCAAGSTCASIFDTRWSNSIAYISPTFAGFSGVAAYVADENKTTETTGTGGSTAAARTTGYDVGLKYANGPWMAAATYNWFQLGDAAGTTGDNVRVGGSYTVDAFSVRAWWEETGFDLKNISGANTKQQKWGIGGTYTLGKAKLLAQYVQALDMDATYVGGVAVNGDNTGAQLAEVGVEYSLSKRTMLKAVYAWLENDSQALFDYGTTAVGTYGVGSTLQGVQMGVRHAF